MQEISLEQVVKLAEQLSAEEQAVLIARLQTQAEIQDRGSLLRARLDAEHQRHLKSGAFQKSDSLRNKYADPPLEISDEELNAELRNISREWEHGFNE